jgi:hypothetical protein
MKFGSILALVPLCIALAPFPASAEEREDQAACVNDAMTVCSQFIPDRERVASCLIANPTRISQACRTALTHFDQSRSPPAAAVAAERPGGARVNSVGVNSPPASRTKLTRASGAPAPLTKLVKASQPPAPRAKLTKVSPVASRAKSVTIP